MLRRFSAVNAGQAGAQAFGQMFGGQVRGQFLLQQVVVLEGVFFSARLQEKIERIVHRHFNHQIDRDLEFTGFFWKHQPPLVVGERVLLPVDVMCRRLHLEGVRNDLAAAMRRRPQANHLGSQIDQPVIGVVGNVVQSSVNGHVLDSLMGKEKPHSLQ